MKDQDIHQVLAQYDEGRLSLVDVEEWMTSREEHWSSLPRSSPGRQAADSIMLAIYEMDAGDRDMKSVDAMLRQASEHLKQHM
jgi:hypothetical protein